MGAGDAGGSPPRVGSGRRRSSDPNLLRAYALINIQHQRTQGSEQHHLELYLSQRRFPDVIALVQRIATSRTMGMDAAAAVAYLLNHDARMPPVDRSSKRAVRRYVRYLDCMNQCFALLGQGRLACDFLEEMVAIVMNTHDGWLRFAIVALENGCADMAEGALGNARKLFPEVQMADSERRQRQQAMDTLLSRLQCRRASMRRTSELSEASATSATTSDLTLADSDLSSGGEASSGDDIGGPARAAPVPRMMHGTPPRSPGTPPRSPGTPPQPRALATGLETGMDAFTSVSPPTGDDADPNDRISALIRKR